MNSSTAQTHSGYIYSLVPVSSELHFLFSSSKNVSCISGILSVAVVAILSRAL